MNRRKLLISSVAGVLVLIGARFGIASPQNAVMRVVRKKLGYLRLDEESLQRFAADVCQRNVVSRFRLDMIDFAGPLYSDVEASPDSRTGSLLRHGEDRVVTQFLISSDFFINGANTDRVVKYLGWFDPLAACGNPFARPVSSALV
jgi:hypothetical protein